VKETFTLHLTHCGGEKKPAGEMTGHQQKSMVQRTLITPRSASSAASLPPQAFWIDGGEKYERRIVMAA